MNIRSLQPQSLWNHFSDLNAVPRASKKEERVIKFIADFAASLGFEYLIDKVGNVIVKKPASPGMEDRKTIVLQSHLDMVHQKNADTVFDFETEGIKMRYENDWIMADGTTLGADNGIGVAAIMAILSSKDIKHPSIEALFTIDEETGMTGAMGLEGGILKASIMLNLDTEDDRELTIGCAGGVDVTIQKDYSEVPGTENMKAFEISVRGLTGGHSGMDIHIGRGNANKIMNRILFKLTKEIEIHISSINGGGLRNAIPRESFSTIAISNEAEMKLIEVLEKIVVDIKSEYKTTDPDVEISWSSIEIPKNFIGSNDQIKLLQAIYACPNGIYRMSPDIDQLVQTSNNLAKVSVQNGNIEILCLTRSSVESEKLDLVDAISSSYLLMGGRVTADGGYPGWAPDPKASIVSLMTDLYKEKYKESPDVNACHAGLECGILGTHYPEMEMISFGPNIRGAHSPDEKVQVSSVQKFWDYLVDTLERIPLK